MWDLVVSVPDHCLSFYFAFWPKIVSYHSEVQKIFLIHLIMLMRYFQLVH